MPINSLRKLENKILDSEDINSTDAEQLYSEIKDDIMEFLSSAQTITRKYRKDIVNLCSITNARSGSCLEDCAFCSQSSHHNTGIPEYPLISEEEMIKRAKDAVLAKTNRYCIVTSGRGVTNEELSVICNAIIKIKNRFPRIKIDASLGILSSSQIDKLKNAGLDRYNHNLETAKSNFTKICTTHTYEDRVRTIGLIKAAGIEVCCGGIMGLGETDKQRIELAFALRELDVDSIPLNFLNPISNTSLASTKALAPFEILKTIAIFRFILPRKEIRICGGRQTNLRSLQSLIFMAGADAIIIGNYLTTKGSDPADDIQMVHDLGLKVDGLY